MGDDCAPKGVKTTSSYNVGLIIAASFGLAGAGLVALATPFVLPALRKHCLPFVPATDIQMANLQKAFATHAKRGENFLDIGSGDGRICRLAVKSNIFDEIHGVELNSILVAYSRMSNLWHGRQYSKIKYYHRNLWKFPIQDYDSICIFGVETMMEPLRAYILDANCKRQIVYACRFPIEDIKQIDEIGDGIDTVWVYEIGKEYLDTTKDNETNENSSQRKK